MNSCESCKYWFVKDCGNHGECRRYPPTGNLLESINTPATYECGEYERREANLKESER